MVGPRIAAATCSQAPRRRWRRLALDAASAHPPAAAPLSPTTVLADLLPRLRSYADGTLARAALEAWLDPIVVGDPLDVSRGDARAWERWPHETRLCERLAGARSELVAPMLERAPAREDGAP